MVVYNAVLYFKLPNRELRAVAELLWFRPAPWPTQDFAYHSFFLLGWLGKAPISVKKKLHYYMLAA
jgi:hypothetical protein